ncbi:glycosyltransferase family 4 protein [Lactobacillus sp. HBUAS51381]|uniref:glycosyltransferase family 4 protein n=1 Tax=Lactobacillus sp. HBUAS51381 TaxID=2722743 RepID=UPI0014572CE6|nr:glycosyltransferase family 4 protein [Lactobacillus sp. HBUAS51381]NLR09047.1 glycosyltransferase family 4 protein [Lactobacillus sp. HBUAS51381]
MKINFVLPENGNKPIGGFKVVFQYANELVKRGNSVSISFLNNLYPERVSNLRAWISRERKRITHGQSTKLNWFKLDSRVELHFNVIFESDFPKADVIVATAVQTAPVVANLDASYGNKFYFIQNYETWAYDDVNRVNNTFKLPLTKIVISKWLDDVVNTYTDDKIYFVPNFLDEKVFYDSQGVEARENIVSMLFHKLPEKNVAFGLKVLSAVKKEIPDLHVKLFGVFDKPDNLPDYITYYQMPTQEALRNDIYGKSKVYLLPSLLEGWCLTGMEAMASGAALVSSRIGGVLDYAKDKSNALLVDPNNLDDFKDSIVSLLEKDSLRVKLANKAEEDLHKFNIKNSSDLLEKVFNGEE